MKTLFLFVAMAISPLFTQAADLKIDIGNVRIQAPGVTVTFGTRDSRGYHWDGEEYRDPRYWERHQGQRGEKYYTGRGNKGVPQQGGGFCPPGQAKKGNC